jgi:ABC-type transport system substrate-binding protein
MIATRSMSPMVAAALVFGVAACNGDRGPLFRPAGNASPRDGGGLRYATNLNVRTLDPAIAYDEITNPVVHAIFDTLVDYEPAVGSTGLGLVPRLAERWTVSPDGLVYTFTLRPGVTYSDGTPLVAGDFVYSLERVRAMAESPFGQFLAEVASITATSQLELEIRLQHPNAAFIYVLTMPFATPLSRAHVERQGPELRNHPLGTGPFMLAAWDEGWELKLQRNPRYWNPARVHLDRIVLRENVPRDTQFMMFERGELDTAERLTPPDLLWVTAQPAWQPYVHRSTTMNAFGSRMNVRMKPFDDKRVRQALNYALDKSHSIKLLGNTATPAHGMLIPGMLGYDATLAPYPHDLAKARALLAEAGYPNGFDIDYVVMADEEAERLAASLQSDLAAAGVRVRIVPLSYATYATAIASSHGPSFSKIGWVADFPDPTTFLDGKFHSRSISDENSSNDSFYANPELDAVLDAARTEPDVARRDALYRRAERILYDDAPWIWDYHQMMTEVVQPYVAGYAPHPVWMRDYTSTWLDITDAGPVSR